MIDALLAALSLPSVGLPALFIIAFVSATLVPMGSEPAVFAVIKLNPELYWPAILVATLGNTLGGIVNYAMGYFAKQAFAKERQTRWFGWLQHFGPVALLLSWLPVVGDPLCVLAGWLKMPLLPSIAWMAIGKLARYLTMTWLLMRVPDSVWQAIRHWL